MAGQPSHFVQHFGHLELIRSQKRGIRFRKTSGNSLVTIAEEVDIAGVLVDLPGAEDMLGEFIAP